MSFSKYTRFGLRADKNLSDLPDPKAALANVLDDFDINANFIPDDLTVIDGLRTTNLYVEDFSELENGIFEYQPIVQNAQGINIVGVKEAINPLVTVRDNLLNKKTVIGDPPYARGGSGPTAKIIPSNALRNGLITDTENEDDLKVLVITGIDSTGGITADQSSYDVRVGDLIVITGTITDGGISGYASGKEYIVRETSTAAGQVTGFHIKDADTGVDVTSSTSGSLAGATFTVIRNAARINNDLSIDAEDIFDSTNSDIVTSDNYWVDGLFAFSNRIYETFKDEFGALMFDGYLSNIVNNAITLQTNGFMLFEKYNEISNQWETIKRVTSTEFDLDIIGSPSGDDITVAVDDIKYLMRNMEFIDDNGATITITSINSTSGVVRCSQIPTLAADSTITITYDYGTTNIASESIYRSKYLIDGENQRHRLFLWWPDVSKFSPPKTRGFYPSSYALIDISDGFGNTYNGMPYLYWYKEKQGAPKSVTKDYSYEKFKRERISVLNPQTNEYLSNEKPVFIRFNPPAPTDYKISGQPPRSTFADNFLHSDDSGPNEFTVTGTEWLGGYKFASVGPTTRVGDYVYIEPMSGVTGIDYYVLQIAEIDSENNIYMNPHQATDIEDIMTEYQTEVGDSVVFNFINGELGLVGIYTGTNSINSTNAADELTHSFKPIGNHADFAFSTADPVVGDYFVDYDCTGHNQFRKISSIDVDLTDPSATGSFKTIHIGGPASYSAGGDRPIAVFAHRGLVDRSIAAVCTNVYGIEATANTTGGASGDNQLTLSGTSQIKVGDYVQFQGIGGAGDPIIPQNTTVASIDSATQITISNSVPSGKTLNAASTVVFIRDDAGPNSDGWGNLNGYVNKEACVLPLNTAPPFVGTNLGLATTSTHPHIVVGGEFGVTGFKFAPPKGTGDSTTVDEVAAGDVLATKGVLVKNKPNNIDPLKSYWVLAEDA